jgi:hypothetical protein
MRRVICVVMGLVASGFAQGAQAEAPDTSVAAFYGATLEVSNVEGWRVQRHLNPDNTFTQTGTDGPVRGTWMVADGKLCTTQEEPRRPTNLLKTYCNAGPGRQPGERWRDRDPLTGGVMYFKLQPGR